MSLVRQMPVSAVSPRSAGAVAERCMLYLGCPSYVNGFISEARSRGWSVFPVAKIGEARALAAKHDFLVGLAHSAFFSDRALMEEWEGFYRSNPGIEWIALLGQDCQENEDLRRLVWQRCHDFHTLPVDSGRLLITLGHAHGMAQLKDIQEPDPGSPSGTGGLIGQSPAMRRLRDTIEKIALVDATVLINGDSGTGKELVAHAIHRRSRRSEAPFQAVNCGAIPSNLIQSELFGYEKGAFTGAQQRKLGKIEAAAGGTIFLDEIGDLPMEYQTNLLRFLQEQTIERVGSHHSIEVDARAVAATHVDLQEAILERRFREDLYFRINVIQLTMPPLRERGSDIELLAEHFFVKFSRESNASARGFSKDAVDAMYAHHWPGNVRELMNRIQHALVMSENRLISPVDLRLEKPGQNGNGLTLETARTRAEKTAIEASLQRTGFNLSSAARKLGISRSTLYRLAAKYDLEVR